MNVQLIAFDAHSWCLWLLNFFFFFLSSSVVDGLGLVGGGTSRTFLDGFGLGNSGLDLWCCTLDLQPASFLLPFETELVSCVIWQAVREAATICPAPCKMTFDLLTIDVKNMDLRIKNIKKHVFYPIIKNMEKTLKICFHVDSVTPKSSTCAGVVMYRVVPKYWIK